MRSWKHYAALSALLVTTCSASAAERTLTMYYFSTSVSVGVGDATMDFIKHVNEIGKGELQIDTTLKNPSSIPPSQSATALKGGIIDIAAVPPSYFSNLVPGIEALSAVDVSPAEQRKNGAYELIDSYLKQRANAHLLAQLGYGSKFHIFTTVPVNTLANFKGLRLRSSRTYKAFFDVLGAQPVLISNGETFSALERGIVRGYANPIVEVKRAGWADVTKYRIDPGFYDTIIAFFVNEKTWNSLSLEQRGILDKSAEWLENVRNKGVEAATDEQAAELKKAGIKVLTLPPDQASEFVALANKATWDSALKEAPTFGPALKKLVLH